MSTKKPIVAAFDFDGTISYFDTLVPFLWKLSGPFGLLFHLFLTTPDFLRFLFGKISRQQAKEALLTKCLKGTPYSQAATAGQDYATHFLKKLIKPAAMQKIAWHSQQQHHLVLISANLNVYLKPWARQGGFQTILASELEIDSEGRITGHLKGKNCWGQEKVERLLSTFGPKENFTLYAYGDSQGDKELLDLADFNFYRRFY
ncbi:Protein CicA [Chlamydiales bacterium STE3]|nr:Protein CicA [Chlamydiales bacterium STE3]